MFIEPSFLKTRIKLKDHYHAESFITKEGCSQSTDSKNAAWTVVGREMVATVITSPIKEASDVLKGKRILVTRATGQAEELSCLLKAHGADVLECPTIRIVPPRSYTALDNALKGLAAYDWVVFTSKNAVLSFVERLQALNLDMHDIDSCLICAVGPKTAELLHGHGMTVELIAGEFTGEGVVTAFAGQDMAGKRVLFPKGDLARDVVNRGASALGCPC